MTGPDRPADPAASIQPPDPDPADGPTSNTPSDPDKTPAADHGDPGASAPLDRGPARPGLRTFTVEGRAAPGLFVVGWLSFLMGAGLLFVAFAAGVGQSAAVILAIVGLALVSLGLVAGAGSQTIERRARAAAAVDTASPGPGYAGPSPFLLFAASVPVAILLVTVLAAPLLGLGLDPQGPAGTLLSVVVQALVYVALIRLVVVGTGALRWRDMGIGGRTASELGGDIAWGVLLVVPIVVLTAFVGGLLSFVLPLPDSPLPPSGGTSGLIVNLLSAAVVAPLGEETFFRGFSTTAWARSISPRAGLVRAALFFAAVHVLTVGGTDFADAAGRALFAFATRLPVAFALGAVFMERRSLASSIALHASFNGLLVLLAGGISTG